MVKKAIAGALAVGLVAIIGFFLNKGLMFGVLIGAFLVWVTK